MLNINMIRRLKIEREEERWMYIHSGAENLLLSTYHCLSSINDVRSVFAVIYQF